MLDRIERLFRSMYGAIVHGSPPPEEKPAAPEAASAPLSAEERAEAEAEERDRRYEELEARRLVEEVRSGGAPGAPPHTRPVASDSAPAGRVEKTIRPAPPAPAAPPPGEKTIGPAPGQPVPPVVAPRKVEKTIGPAGAEGPSRS